MLAINTLTWIKKDIKYRKIFAKTEMKKIALKSALFNVKTNYKHKMYFDDAFKKITTKGSISRCHTYCVFLGNTRSVFRKFKMSRHAAKKYASHGFIPGLKKSSF